MLTSEKPFGAATMNKSELEGNVTFIELTKASEKSNNYVLKKRDLVLGVN